MKTNTAFVQGQRHFLRGEYGRSIMGFGGALEAGMDAAQVHVPLGLAYFKNRNFAEAVTEFSHGLHLAPDNAQLYFLRGMARFNLGELAPALADLTAAIDRNPHRGQFFVARSLVQQALGREVAADADLQSAVVLADVEVESFIREYCLTAILAGLAMSLFDVEQSAWGRDLRQGRDRHRSH